MFKNDHLFLTRVIAVCLLTAIPFNALYASSPPRPQAKVAASPVMALPNPAIPDLGVDPKIWTKAASAEIIAAADRAAISTFLGPNGTSVDPTQMKRFEHAFARVARANQELGINDDAEGFDKWFQVHEMSALFQRDQMGHDVSMQMFFMNLYKAYKVEQTNAVQDPSAFMKWINGVVENPYVRAVSQNTYVDALATTYFILGIIRGAVTAGPAAGIVNAFTDKIMTPLMQKVGLIGSKLLGPTGVYLNNLLFNNEGAQTPENEEEVSKKSEKMIKAYQDTRAQLNSLGYDLTPNKYSRTFRKIYLSWNWFQQILSQTHPATLQGGRGAALDALGFRPKDFARDVMQATTAIEVQRQGIDQIIDRIVLRNHADPQALEAAATDSFKALQLIYEQPSSEAVPPQLIKDAESAGQRLVELGATSQQADQIITNQRHTLIVTRFAASTLAAHIRHDLQLNEYNRGLPAEFYQLSNSMRANFGLDYFHYEFGKQVVQILNQTGVELSIATGRVNEAMKALAEIAPHDHSTDSVRALSIVEDVISDAKTRTAVERTSDLSRERSADKSSIDSSVRDVIDGVGKR